MVVSRHPVDAGELLQVRGFADLLGGLGEVDLVRRVDHAGHRLERQEMLDGVGHPACLFHHLAHGSIGGCLAGIQNSARQLPAPLIRRESMPPEHQHLVLIVKHDRQHYGLQPNNVMLEPLPARRLDIHERQLDPRIVVDGPLTVDLRPHLFGTVKFGHFASLRGIRR